MLPSVTSTDSDSQGATSTSLAKNKERIVLRCLHITLIYKQPLANKLYIHIFETLLPSVLISSRELGSN